MARDHTDQWVEKKLANVSKNVQLLKAFYFLI